MPFKVTLEFETKDDADNWVAGYLDGGCAQHLGYDANLDRSTWKDAPRYRLTLRGYRQCPGCRFSEIGTREEYEKRFAPIIAIDASLAVKDRAKSHKCQNCGCECDEKDIVNT